MNESIFDKLDFGPLRSLLDNDDITDISYCNNGQIWIRSLTQGSLRVEVEGATPEFIEKLAFQCSNVMGTTFNNAKPFLDAESAELRLNFVHDSIATNGIALVIRKTPAKIRLEKDKLLEEDYFTANIHDFLIKCVEGHCNVMVAGETGSGKTEFVKYLASHTKTSEKIITIEDTLELHLDRIFPQRDIVAMKTNNVASYSDVLVTCMRQNPKWILLSEVRSAEAVSAVRNSISSGHNILSTIHADKASAIPYRLYSLMETDLDVNQFLTTIYRYIQLGVHIKAFYSKKYGKFHRELDEVAEFYVDDQNVPKSRIIYQKIFGVEPVMIRPSNHLLEYLENQNIDVSSIIEGLPEEMPHIDANFDEDGQTVKSEKEEENIEQPVEEEKVEEQPEVSLEDSVAEGSDDVEENVEESSMEEEIVEEQEIPEEETATIVEEAVPVEEPAQIAEQIPEQVVSEQPASEAAMPGEETAQIVEQTPEQAVPEQPVPAEAIPGEAIAQVTEQAPVQEIASARAEVVPQQEEATAVINVADTQPVQISQVETPNVQATIPGIVEAAQPVAPVEAVNPAVAAMIPEVGNQAVQPVAPVEAVQQVAQPVVATEAVNPAVQAVMIPEGVNQAVQPAPQPVAPVGAVNPAVQSIMAAAAPVQPINPQTVQGDAIAKLSE